MQSLINKPVERILAMSQEKPHVAIVIAGHNSSEFLHETIASALQQAIPCEVIYVDDSSVDASLCIASKYIKDGLRVISTGVHVGVCKARNLGARATSAPYIIFLDTDDKLPRNYSQLMLADAIRNPDAPFIFPSTQCFGTADTFWKNLEWSKYDMWFGNQVSTTAMWARWAFLGAGEWQDLPTMWDYDLAIRCSRLGTPYAGKAILNYRQHENSQSIQLNERMAGEAIPYKEQIRRKNVSVGIGCLVSGRLLRLFPKWLTNLSKAVRYHRASQASNWLQHYPSGSPKLLLLLHTEAQSSLQYYQMYASKFVDSFDSIQFAFINDKVDRTTEFGRRHSTSNLLANACNIMQDTLSTDLVFLLEDDIFPCMSGYHSLVNKITAGHNPPIGVSGCYYNRHPGYEHRLLGGWLLNGKHAEPTAHFRPSDVVDFVGTGCLMYWRNRPGTPKTWKPLTEKFEPGTTAHDWAWSEEVQGTLMIDGETDCQHYINETEYV
jgi:glycosyltransferase involved in cell wall biosynthesis